VLGLVGDRISLSVTPDGITVHGLLRRRHTPWGRIRGLAFSNRYDLIKSGAIERWADDIASAGIGVPIPGLRWLVRRLVGGITEWLERRLLEDEAVDRLRDRAGVALTDIDRRGFDIELSGSLLLVSLLGVGVNEAILAEAALRGVAVQLPDGSADAAEAR
jgi:hypothetical protein